MLIRVRRTFPAFRPWLFLLGCCLALNAFGARPSFLADPTYLIDTWETEDGLPENSATAMVQTPEGYLWFGTFNGLVRFDGVKFAVFNRSNTPQLPSDGVVNLHVDRIGRLWVSTYRGLTRLDGAQWRVFGTNDGWVGDLARSFAERANGDLLVTTFDGKVLEYSSDRFTQLPTPPGREGAGYFGFADEAGVWWVVQQWFVGSWNGERWAEAAGVTNRIPRIISAGRASDGGLWLFVAGPDLYKIRAGKQVQHVPLPHKLGSPWSISEDSRGNIWIATYDEGLSCVSSEGVLRRWNTSNGLSYNGTRFVFEDREQNLWVGTSGGGLQRFKPRRFRSYGDESGLTERNVTSVSPDSDGGVWIATYGKGVFRWSAGAVKSVDPSPGRNALSLVNSVLADRAGRTWFGTWGQGVGVLEASDFHRIPPEQTGGSNMLSLFEDTIGRIWAGGEREASVSDGNAFRLIKDEFGVAVPGIRCFAQDREGAVWVSNLEDLFRLEKDHFVKVLNRGASLRDISSIKADADGTLWLGSQAGGLLCWRTGRFVQVNLGILGQPSPRISGILEDEGGFFWMPSNRGILRVARNELLAAADGNGGHHVCPVLDVTDGLPSAECANSRQPVCGRDGSGRLWFATLKGVAMIDPTAFHLNPVPPNLVVEQVVYRIPSQGAGQSKSQDATVSPPKNSSPADEVEVRLVPPFDRSLRLPAGSRRIEIQYTALNFTAPEKVRFQVQLQQGDKEWHDVGDRRIAYYYDFRPGNYVFRVRAANNDGKWNETGASLAFAIQPFVWQTAWFRTVVALMLASSGGGGVWMWARARLRRAAEREKTAGEIRDLAGRLITAQEAERTRLARELHDDLSQSLALLSVDLELFGQKPLSAPDQINARMQVFSSQVKDLSSEVHRLSHELHPAKLEQLGLTAALRGFCKELSAAHQMAVHFEAGDVPRTLPNDVALCLYRITQEALQNVIKHSGAASAQVTLACAENEILLSVVDDGEGFDAATVQGHGSLGLVSMRERVRLVRGRLSVESKRNEGTRVEVRVPLSPSK